jgi:four helix bundle protein
VEQKSPYLHDRLDAYRAALEAYRAIKSIRAHLPRGLGPLGDQLSRAGQSVCLNLAEGSAARSRDVKRRHWDIALGSAGECAAALDLVEVECGARPELLTRARGHLRVATLLTLGLVR